MSEVPVTWLMAAGGLAAATAIVVTGVSLARRRRNLDHVLRRIAWQQLEDVVIPDDVDGEIHLDLALLTSRGILVLDIRRVSGTLFWGDQLERWTVLDGARRQVIDNPMPGLNARRHAVHALAPRVPVDGRILLVGPVQVSGAMPPGVLLPEGLVTAFPARDRKRPPPEALLAGWNALVAAARPA
jgi:hypothetical protein